MFYKNKNTHLNEKIIEQNSLFINENQKLNNLNSELKEKYLGYYK